MCLKPLKTSDYCNYDLRLCELMLLVVLPNMTFSTNGKRYKFLISQHTTANLQIKNPSFVRILQSILTLAQGYEQIGVGGLPRKLPVHVFTTGELRCLESLEFRQFIYIRTIMLRGKNGRGGHMRVTYTCDIGNSMQFCSPQDRW